MMYYKVYNEGSSHRKFSGYYPSECSDIQPGLPKLTFPANSDKLPPSMRIKNAHGHHHHHNVMGDASEEEKKDDDDDDGEEVFILFFDHFISFTQFILSRLNSN